ncbi:MAG: YhgE/Pip family protein, partial [Bacillota bacterium]|nr:YhgE/Pip family protein [Bacillota bacterium]
AQQISGGNGSVNEGWQALTAGVTKIHSGADKVSAGNSAVASGWGDLTSGVIKLDNGAQKLNDGSKELADGLNKGADEAGKLKVNDKNISMFASPLETVGKKVNTFPVYTVSTAPYVLSLALFVGILIMSFFFDFKKPVGVAISGFAWFVDKFSKWSLLAVVQALILSLFVLVFLNYKIDNGFMFVLFALFASLAFSTIVFLLVTIAGNIGRLAALALIVLQLDITGANLPIEMLPENMRALSTYLPFTYTIAGFKSIISFNNVDIAWTNAYVLIAYIAGFALLAVTASLFFFMKKDELVEVSA